MPQKKKAVLTYLLICALALLLFFYSDRALASAKEALGLCARSLIPSLFPYLVLSELIIKSGLGVKISRIFARPAKKLFGIGGEGACAFFCGAVCGFPVGALTAVTLYEEGDISKTEASRLLLFCNNTGPGFLISGVGAAMFGSARFGVLLYVVQLFCALIIGVVSKKFRVPDKCPAAARQMRKSVLGAPLFTDAVACAAKNMISVCGYIVFFSVLSGVLSSFFPEAVVSGLLEISSGCAAAAELLSSGASETLAASVCAFVVGWSGLSVHAQTAAICRKSDIPLLPYIAAKFVQGALCSLFVFLCFTAFPAFSLPAFADAESRANTVPVLLPFAVNFLFIFAVIKNLIKKCGKKRFFVIL